MNRALRTFILSCALSSLAAAAFADTMQSRKYVVTDASGSRIATETQDGTGGGITLRSTGIIWQYEDQTFSIPQNVALTPSSNSAWVAQDLNNERLQLFSITGDGTPINEFSILGTNGSTVTGSKGSDKAALVWVNGSNLTMNVYSSTSFPSALWTYTFPSDYTSLGYHGVGISRDGSRVCVVVYSSTLAQSNLYIFDGNGNLLRNWTYPDYADGVNLTDDGALCLVTQSTNGRLVDTNTATEIFSAPGSGGGGWHKISGDGKTLVLGGFSFQVYRDSGSGYNLVINFSAGDSWFGWGAAVSRDGKTAGAMSHHYLTYSYTDTRIWDVDSATLLGTYTTPTTGDTSFQDAISGGVMSDDGSVFGVCSWGTADNIHPEVMYFDRGLNLIGSIDTTGSPFSLDLSGDGVYSLAGNKAVHANTFGNGGTTTSYQVIEAGGCIPGDLNCDCVVDLVDLATQLANYGLTGGATREQGDMNGDGNIDLTDLAALLAVYGTTCP